MSEYKVVQVASYMGYTEVHLGIKGLWGDRTYLFKDGEVVHASEETFQTDFKRQRILLTDQQAERLWSKYRLHALYADAPSCVIYESFIRIHLAMEQENVFDIRYSALTDSWGIYLENNVVTRGFCVMECEDELFTNEKKKRCPHLMMEYLCQKNIPFISHENFM